jgi:hypothetical protein
MDISDEMEHRPFSSKRQSSARDYTGGIYNANHGARQLCEQDAPNEFEMEVVTRVIAIGATLLEPRICAKLRRVVRPPSPRTQKLSNIERVWTLISRMVFVCRWNG